MPYLPSVKVTAQEKVAPGCYRLSFLSYEISGLARPGQFLHVRVAKTLEPLLRRPFSIHAVSKQTGEVSILYRVSGRGTELLSQKKEGDSLDVLGPLGKCFTLPSFGQSVALVAGGIGIAPLFFLARELTGQSKVYFLLGARTADELLTLKSIQKLSKKAELMISTDDGSRGWRGPVTDLLTRLLENRMVDMVYACGPKAMLQSVSSLAEKYGVEAELSLEEYMGCGIGACLGCVCKTKSDSGFSYSRVCLEGPVFKAAEVIWD